MGTVPNGFFQAVLQGIHAPITTDNLRAFIAWQRAEGGTARYNPFNTTQAVPGSTWYNTFGSAGQYHVRNYPTENAGIGATVSTLTNGNYSAILSALQAGHTALQAGHNGLVVARAIDASAWGTKGAVQTYVALYGTGTPTPRILKYTTPLMQGSDVRLVQEALIRHGYGVGVNGADGFYGTATRDAVVAFQRGHHLAVDGVVGYATRHALGLV